MSGCQLERCSLPSFQQRQEIPGVLGTRMARGRWTRQMPVAQIKSHLLLNHRSQESYSALVSAGTDTNRTKPTLTLGSCPHDGVLSCLIHLDILTDQALGMSLQSDFEADENSVKALSFGGENKNQTATNFSTRTKASFSKHLGSCCQRHPCL